MRELSEKADQDWRAFVSGANWGMLHAYDQERFRRFVMGLHVRGETFYDSDLSELLDETPCPDSTRGDLLVAFNTGIEILQDYDQVRGITE